MTSQQGAKRDHGQVGLIGLGHMGAAIAARMLSMGVPLHVCDPNVRAVRACEERGATAHASPRAVADVADVVFACLPSKEVSFAVAFGEDGVASGKSMSVYLELSTIGRDPVQLLAGKLAERGKTVLDAPVSGGPQAALDGTLSIMIAGAPAAVQRVEPLLRTFGKNIFPVSETPGLGQMMKVVNNLLSIANITAAFEALVLGAKAGLDADLMLRVLNTSSGRNAATETMIAPAVLTGAFNAGARMAIIDKDLKLALDEAEAQGVPMWSASALRQLWRFGIAQGGAEQDFSTLIRHLESWAGVEVRSKASERTRV
jgi:3-hydroxyisobutyrate dehydrogenase-like beta-hydroxyacid dehydrogenase